MINAKVIKGEVGKGHVVLYEDDIYNPIVIIPIGRWKEINKEIEIPLKRMEEDMWNEEKIIGV